MKSEEIKFSMLGVDSNEPGRSVEFEIEMRTGYERKERSRKFARAFVWCEWADKLPEDSIEEAAKTAGSVITRKGWPHINEEYIGTPNTHTKRGEFPTVDKAWDQHNREIVRRKSIVLREGLKTLVKEGHNDIKFRFSRTAGCGCGCSPGFIVEGVKGDITFYVDQVKPKEVKKAVAEDASTACPTL